MKGTWPWWLVIVVGWLLTAVILLLLAGFYVGVALATMDIGGITTGPMILLAVAALVALLLFVAVLVRLPTWASVNQPACRIGILLAPFVEVAIAYVWLYVLH